MLIKVENIVAKEEIPYQEQFHLWPQCFQKSSAAIASAGGKVIFAWVNLFKKKKFWALFPHGETSIYAADDFERLIKRYRKISINNRITIE